MYIEGDSVEIKTEADSNDMITVCVYTVTNNYCYVCCFLWCNILDSPLSMKSVCGISNDINTVMYQLIGLSSNERSKQLKCGHVS